MVNLVLKTILAGEGGVGKTSLVRSFMKQRFTKDYKITIGVDVSSQSIQVNGNRITFSVHDVAGQARFESVKNMFFRGTHLALLVFDLTRKDTLTSVLKQWVVPLMEANQEDIYSILIGNKCDLEDLRVIEPEEGEALFELLKKEYPSMNIIKYLETSALQNKNVELAFDELARAILSNNL
ncbi:MAG: GTP-binding protein [Candidatus Hodarchaeales archaeon]|jgi:small GTP-binding protein